MPDNIEHNEVTGQPAEPVAETGADTSPLMQPAPEAPDSQNPARRVTPWAWIIGCGVLLVCLVGAGLLGALSLRQAAVALKEVAAVAPTPTPTRRPAATATWPPTATATQPPATATLLPPLSTITPMPTATGPTPTAGPTQHPDCTDPLGCVVVEPLAPVYIAAALALSGLERDMGRDSQYGVEIAIDLKDNILGHPISLIVEDEECSVVRGTIAIRAIVSDPQVVGIIGTSCDVSASVAAMIVSRAGYVMISPSHAIFDVTDELTHETGYLRTSQNELVQAAAMAEFAFNGLGVRRAGVVHDYYAETEKMASAFRDSFVALGGEIVAYEGIEDWVGDATPALQRIAEAGPPDLIYFPVGVEAGEMIARQVRGVAGLENVILASWPWAFGLELLADADEPADGAYIAAESMVFENDDYYRLLEEYIVTYETEPLFFFHAHAYDATMLLMNAVEQVAQVTGDGSLLIGRQALRDALYATSGYQGATGVLTCTPTGDCADAETAIFQLQDGEYWPVQR